MSTLKFRPPQRVQMSHRRRWRDDHPGVIDCRPPSRWASPYRVAPVLSGTDIPACRWGVWKDGQLIADYEAGITATGARRELSSATRLKMANQTAKRRAATKAVQLFRDDLYNSRLAFTIDDLRAELAGHDLGCRCPIWDEAAPCELCGGKGNFKITPGFQTIHCYQCGGTGYARWPCHANIEVAAANTAAVPFDWDKMSPLEATDDFRKAHPGCAYTPGLRRGQQ